LNPRLATIFQDQHSDLRPRTPLPDIHATFHRFANINNTIRIREGRVYARISDLLEGAPDDVIAAIAHILLAKLYRKPIEPSQAARYRKHVSSQGMAAKAHLIRTMRGRKHLLGARGEVYDLHELFDDLNRRFFHGLLGRPEMTWSREQARNSLGHYDPAHNTIVVSRIFDRPQVHVMRWSISSTTRCCTCGIR